MTAPLGFSTSRHRPSRILLEALALNGWELVTITEASLPARARVMRADAPYPMDLHTEDGERFSTAYVHGRQIPLALATDYAWGLWSPGPPEGAL